MTVGLIIAGLSGALLASVCGEGYYKDWRFWCIILLVSVPPAWQEIKLL